MNSSNTHSSGTHIKTADQEVNDWSRLPHGGDPVTDVKPSEVKDNRGAIDEAQDFEEQAVEKHSQQHPKQHPRKEENKETYEQQHGHQHKKENQKKSNRDLHHGEAGGSGSGGAATASTEEAEGEGRAAGSEPMNEGADTGALEEQVNRDFEAEGGATEETAGKKKHGRSHGGNKKQHQPEQQHGRADEAKDTESDNLASGGDRARESDSGAATEASSGAGKERGSEKAGGEDSGKMARDDSEQLNLKGGDEGEKGENFKSDGAEGSGEQWHKVGKSGKISESGAVDEELEESELGAGESNKPDEMNAGAAQAGAGAGSAGFDSEFAGSDLKKQQQQGKGTGKGKGKGKELRHDRRERDSDSDDDVKESESEESAGMGEKQSMKQGGARDSDAPHWQPAVEGAKQGIVNRSEERDVPLEEQAGKSAGIGGGDVLNADSGAEAETEAGAGGDTAGAGMGVAEAAGGVGMEEKDSESEADSGTTGKFLQSVVGDWWLGLGVNDNKPCLSDEKPGKRGRFEIVEQSGGDGGEVCFKTHNGKFLAMGEGCAIKLVDDCNGKECKFTLEHRGDNVLVRGECGKYLTINEEDRSLCCGEGEGENALFRETSA